MERHLNLVKSDFERLEKRILPRFPICYLTFKASEEGSNRVFEVKDISDTGMQLALRDGEHSIEKGSSIKGTIRWQGREIVIF